MAASTLTAAPSSATAAPAATAATAVTTQSVAAASTATVGASPSSGIVQSTDSATGFQFVLLGPQYKVGAGGEWYLRTAGSIIGGTTLIPSTDTINSFDPSAITGNPSTAGTYTGSAGSGTAVSNSTNTATSASGTSTQPSWLKPVEIGGGIVGAIVLLAIGSFIYSKQTRTKEASEEAARKRAELSSRASASASRTAIRPTPIAEQVVAYEDLAPKMVANQYPRTYASGAMGQTAGPAAYSYTPAAPAAAYSQPQQRQPYYSQQQQQQQQQMPFSSHASVYTQASSVPSSYATYSQENRPQGGYAQQTYSPPAGQRGRGQGQPRYAAPQNRGY